MFKPDQPIKSFKEDILDRNLFAKSLGDAILGYKEKDSIVIGLFGPWGSGKTSIINMALEHIDLVSKNQSDDNSPIVLKFNPWNFSDQHQLITQFFRQLSVVLRRTDYPSDIKRAGEELETYAKLFEPLAFIPKVGPIAIILSKVFKKLGSAAKSWGDLKSNGLNAIRTKLNELLSKQSHKIIVVIDDIDRLNNTEIRQIFQLIKSLGDFPNTIYLLAFDKDVIIKALAKVQEGSGIEYLEKVVQIPFEVPVISKEKVERLLFSRLDELIKDIPENKWDQTYWGNIYHSGLKHFFRHIRDVTRYINSLRFSFGIVKGEVNVIDLIAITAIQVFAPEIYYGIRDNKDIFAGVFDSAYERSNAAREQAQKRYKDIIGRAKKPPGEVWEDLLKRLFPKLESGYGHEWLDSWRKDCRICSPDIFDTFFRLSLAEGEVAQKEIETILSLGNNSDSFSEALLSLNEDGRILRFLERLEDYTRSDIPEDNIEPIITALMDVGDLFPEGDSGIFRTDSAIRLLRLFYQLSHRFKSHEKRFNVLKRAMEKSTRSLYTIVNEISVQDQQHARCGLAEKSLPDEQLTVSAAHLDDLERLVCAKIETWAKDGRLRTHRNLSSILFSWKRWRQQDQIDSFVSNMIGDDDGLIDFIAVFLNKSTSVGMSDHVGKTHWWISVKSIEEFVILKEIEPRIRSIQSSPDFKKLDEQKKLAIRTFLDTVDGKEEFPYPRIQA